jgi:transposase
MVAIGMIMRGMSQADVARRLHVTREAVRQWVEAWRAGGPAALAPRPRVRRRRVDLLLIADALSSSRHSPETVLTTRRVRQIIQRTFGVGYCASSARSILHRLGFTFSRKQGWHRTTEREARRRAS